MIPDSNMPSEVSSSARRQGRQGGAGHEKTDARAAWIFGIVFCLAVAGLALHFVVLGVFNVFQRRPLPSDAWPQVTQAQRAATGWTNRFPPLQVSPPLDLQHFRIREDAELNSYRWINATVGVVQIPIARAMDLLLEKGLPVRHGTNDPKVGPSSWELENRRARGEGKKQ
jgi:hypothetical protein